MRHHHNASKAINEGMREGDLADLVLPLLSVDEYKSKVSPSEAIVFGFYVHDHDAAKDFNRFVQKSAVPIIDTEVSPAPDQHGYYMVFIEMLMNDRVAQNMQDILSEIRNLVDIDEWDMRVRNRNSLVPFSERNLTRALTNNQKDKKDTDVIEFLQPSALKNVLIENNILVLEGGAGERYTFEIVDLGYTPILLENLNEAITLTMRTVARTNRITRMLGENWQAIIMGPYMLLQRTNDARSLLLWN